MVIVWILWPLGAGVMTELDFDLSTKLLFHQNLVLPRSSSNGWNNGAKETTREYPSRFKKSADKHKKQPSGMHHEFSLVLA